VKDQREAKALRRFFRAAAKPIAVAWQLAVGGDLALPETRGDRPRGIGLTNAYVDRILTAGERDPALVDRFLRVSTLLDPPTRLLRPTVVRRAWTGGRPARPAGPPVTGSTAGDRRSP